MKLETDAQRRAGAMRRRRNERRRRAGTALGIASGVLLGVLASLAALDWSRFPALESSARSVRAPLRFAVARATGEPPTTLVIDQKFKHLHRLHAQRERALLDGYLLEDEARFVPAVVSSGGDATAVRIQLLGPGPEPLERGVWPLLVEIEDGRSLLGMRRFALLPIVRDPTPAALLLQHARDHELPAARQRFVTLVWNGENLGAYEVHESPSRHQVRASGRNSSAVIAWNVEEHLRKTKAGDAPWDDAFTAPLRVAPSEALDNAQPDDAESLKRNERVALGLLRAFQTGEIGVDETFDLRDTAEVLALAELWDLPELLHWTELHFSYDATSARLSPIAQVASVPSDAAGSARTPRASTDGSATSDGETEAALAIAAENLARVWLADPQLRALFEDALLRFSNELATARRNVWQARIDEFLALHHYASPWSGAPDARSLLGRANRLVLQRPDVAQRLADAPPLPAPRRLVVARDQRSAADGRIELAAAGAFDVGVTTLGTGQGQHWAPLLLDGRSDFPIRLQATRPGRPRPLQIVRYHLPTARRDAAIQGRARAIGGTADESFVVRPGTRGLGAAPLAGPSLDELLSRHPFLAREQSASGVERLRIRAGTWDVRGTLITPPTHALVLEAGARLRFQAERGLLVRGGLEVLGTSEEPVVLEGGAFDAASRETGRGAHPWGGVAVVSAGAPVHIRDTIVRDAAGFTRRDWSSNSAVLVRAPRFDAQRLRIERSRAPAALTIDRCSAALSEISIDESLGHALRLRHARVAADRLRVRGAQHRSWWQTGGRASLRAGHFSGVGDAAVELDAAARLEASDLVILGAALGLVARDGASARVEGGRVDRATHAAVLAFGDPNGWGPARVEANALRIEDSGDVALVQRGSLVSLDGISVEPVDVDFAGLRRGF